VKLLVIALNQVGETTAAACSAEQFVSYFIPETVADEVRILDLHDGSPQAGPASPRRQEAEYSECGTRSHRDTLHDFGYAAQATLLRERLSNTWRLLRSRKASRRSLAGRFDATFTERSRGGVSFFGELLPVSSRLKSA